MHELFVRTLSQGLQAFLPIAVWLTWARVHRRADLWTAVRWGALAAIPATPLAGYLFQHSLRQARWEALLAAVAAAVAICFGWNLWRRIPGRSESRLQDRSGAMWQVAVAGTAVLLVVRQTMEIDVVLMVAAFELRSLEAIVAICGAVTLALAAASAWMWFGRRCHGRALASATSTFCGVSLGVALMYAFHESAEARLLPWSDILHAATEPYGPDGQYGQWSSYLLLAFPIATAVATSVRARVEGRPSTWIARVHPQRYAAWAIPGLLAMACLFLVRAETDVSTASREGGEPAVSVNTVATVAAGPHLLFQHTGVDRDYSMLTIAALEPPGARAVSVPLACERISFAAGQGICLQAHRGLFTTYTAVLFDQALAARRSIKLDGSPSRTRISADGRVGAFTVFVTGQAHGYSSVSFSTKTTLIDMSSGDVLGDLEQFTTWRNGARFQAPDFNFWGVTFARDSNIFYASLRTGAKTPQTTGQTYLVRGDLGLRKLTVLRENVECPSLSPNNRLIAFKKRVGNAADPWRLYVLDLATMTERAVAAEDRSVDDQIEWLDDAHVLYATPRSAQSAITDVWISPIDGSGPARVFVPQAASPIVVR
jgi:hypothetical protein